MDSKIILAILVVALIGIVAATYHTETNDAINSLANVATEPATTESSNDIEDASSTSDSDSDSSIKIDEDTVKPDKTASTTSKTKKQVKSASTSTKSNSQVSTSQKTQKSTNNVQSKISKSKAESIAKSQIASQYPSATANAVLKGNYYLVTIKNNGQIIGEYEINAITGKVTGGAMVNEVPDPDEYYQTIGQLVEE